MSSVRVVSQESVKPSSPTPPHLRTYKLSWIDQLNPLAHIPITLFYPDDVGHNDSSEAVIGRLKAALSQTLTRFYPLAGRLVSNSHVDCNDEGAEFYETRVNGSLDRAINPLDIGLVTQLLPCARSCSCSGSSKILLSVQVNVFDCHGMAIGVCFPHKIADGRSLFHFLRSWAALVAGDPLLPAEPAFNAVYHFPANERAIPQTGAELNGPEAVAVSKRWVFDASQISAMKSSSSLVPSPSRVEVVMGLIWRCIIRARARASGDLDRGSVAVLSVDVRGRMEPPCPDCCFSNHWILSAAGATAAEMARIREGVLQERIRSAVKAISGDYVRRLQGEDGFTMAFDAVGQAVEKCSGGGGGGFDLYMFTSWLRFPVYELDFGWGKPIWFTSLSGVAKNFICLMPRRGDEGVEAWVGLEEKHMTEFERDEELLHLTSN